MKPMPLIAALGVAAIALSACNDRGDHMVNSGVCADFKKPAAAMPGADPSAAPVDECLRRWAYSLAGSRDTADMVADAAVSACASRLSTWNQTVMQQPQDAGADQSSGVSILTGQPTNPLAEHSVFARGRALLYVVQARAGRCEPPPMTNGAPNGA
jgi:hypothetical protein